MRREDHDTRTSAALECFVRALDFFPVGVVALDAHGEIIHINSAAVEMTERRDGLSIERRQLTAVRAAEGARLRDAIAQNGHSGIAVTRAGSKRPYQLWITRVQSADTRQISCVAMIVLMIDPEHRTTAAESILEKFYELTPAEARMAAHLMNGCSIAQAARALHIRPETAKTHLKRIFAKTQTQRQSELVHVLMQSAAALRLGG
jgi:DNA-binding CsgD family transcriptional regulator